MNSIKGHGKLGSKEWDINQILGFDDEKDLIDYVGFRFKKVIEGDNLTFKAIEIAEAHHDDSGRTDT
jgi:hypothetical protein